MGFRKCGFRAPTSPFRLEKLALESVGFDQFLEVRLSKVVLSGLYIMALIYYIKVATTTVPYIYMKEIPLICVLP